MRKKTIFGLIFFTAVCSLAFSQGDILQGEKLYQIKCGRCHFAYSPEKYSSKEWKTIVNEMGPLSGLTEEGEKNILEYLKQKSSRKEEGGLPTSPVLTGYIYSDFFKAKDIVDTFDIHYLNVGISGRLHNRVSYHAEFEFEHGGGGKEPPFIEKAYVDVWLQRNTALRIGAILTPFNRFDDFHAPLENLLVTRPQVSREIGVSAWKDVGINLHGNLVLSQNLYLNYDIYTINGLGAGSRLRKSRQYKDNNDAKSLGFRVSGVFADSWEVGASYYHGAWDDEGDYDLDMYGLHFLAKIDNLNLHAEYSKATSENPDPVAEGKTDGFFVQASYLLDGKFRPTIRYGTLDYLDYGRTATDFDTKVLALGFNYYLTNSIVFKVEYDFVGEGDRKTKKENKKFFPPFAKEFGKTNLPLKVIQW